MAPSRPTVLGALAVLLVLGGCLGGVSDSPTRPTTAPPATTATTPTATARSPSPGATAGCAKWVSFYGLGTPGETAWGPDRIAIGYTVEANASVFFVAFEEGTVLGTTHVTTRAVDYGVTADGDGVPLDEPLTGSHVVLVRAYRDSDGNGEFDLGTDEPCRNDGTVVETDPRRINFSAVGNGPTPGASPTATAS